MIKNILGFVTTLILATSVIAGGDDINRGPVEPLDALGSMPASSSESGTEIIESTEGTSDNQSPEKMKLTVAGKNVSVVAHIACQDKLGLTESNISIFRRAQTAGNLYNTGPIENFGTEFSPKRWNTYFECVTKNGG